MGLTDREGYLELRARYLRLVAALRLTRESNPETLEAIERIIQPVEANARLALATIPILENADSIKRGRHAA